MILISLLSFPIAHILHNWFIFCFSDNFLFLHELKKIIYCKIREVQFPQAQQTALKIWLVIFVCKHSTLSPKYTRQEKSELFSFLECLVLMSLIKLLLIPSRRGVDKRNLAFQNPFQLFSTLQIFRKNFPRTPRLQNLIVMWTNWKSFSRK